MRDTRNTFHLAIPVNDLDEAYDFYVAGLGAHLARRRDDRITLDFFGDQVVCHLHPVEAPAAVDLYPRHFGITFHDRKDLDDLVRLVDLRGLAVVHEPGLRFEGTVEEHVTFVIRDPSWNLLEFKWYRDPRMMY